MRSGAKRKHELGNNNKLAITQPGGTRRVRGTLRMLCDVMIVTVVVLRLCGDFRGAAVVSGKTRLRVPQESSLFAQGILGRWRQHGWRGVLKGGRGCCF